MEHPIYRIISTEPLGEYRLRLGFDDGSAQEIDFEPILHGELYGLLRDPKIFAAVAIDPESAYACVAQRSRF